MRRPPPQWDNCKKKEFDMNMKKNLLAALAAFMMAAAFARDYEIGDTGPGGGTVFLIEDGEVYEVSETLGEGTWLGAKSLCRNYRGGGYDDWRLPKIDELAAVYENLDVDEIDDIESDSPGDIYWSATATNRTHSVAVSFYNGFVTPMHYNTRLSVVAVRSF